VGPHLFSQYEQWLAKTQKAHNRNNLISWIENEYIDDQGNLRYRIEGINGMTVRDGKAKVMINGAPKRLVVEGWAFDSHTKKPADGLMLIIDNHISSRADFRYDRPDVAKYFSLGEQYYGHFPVGWRVEFNTDHVGKGCHNVSIRPVRNGSENLEIPLGYEVCF
jgi:hypothetical protein